MLPHPSCPPLFPYTTLFRSRVAEEVTREKGTRLRYLVGTMIEIPRGALTADEIAGVAEFFSFGTNDLTQTTLGVSRDDARSEEHTSELQSLRHLVCRLLLEK